MRRTRGRRMVKVAPAPGWLCTRISPPLCSTISLAVLNPRPVPLPSSLGGEERLEHVRQNAGLDAAAGIAYREGHAGFGVGRGDPDSAAGRHGVARVQDQVHDHLLHLARVGHYQVQLLAGNDFEVDLLADDRTEHPVHLTNQAIQVERGGRGGSSAREVQKLVGEARPVPDGVAHLLPVRRAADPCAGARCSRMSQ